MKKSLIDLIKILEPKIEEKKEFIASLQGDKNPQVLELIARNEGELAALEGVLYYAKTGSKQLI